MHTSLHSRRGATLGSQHDQKVVVGIAKDYLAKMEAGEMVVEHISEIHLGNGKYVRTFVMQE